MLITLPNIWLVFIVISSFVLAFFIYFKNPRGTANKFYALTVANCAIWAFFMLMFRITEGKALKVWALLLWAATVPIVYLFLCSVLNFPKEARFKDASLVYSLLALPSLGILFICVLYIGLFKEIGVIVDGHKGFVFKLPNFYFYSVYIVIYFVASFIILFHKYFTGEDKAEKAQIILVLIGALIASAGGVIFGLILPLMGKFHFYWLSPGLLISVFLFFAYAILRHHLLNVKVVATEVFSVLIVLILLVDATTAKSRTELIMKLFLFMMTAVFSILLIRNVLNQIRTRNKIRRMAHSLKQLNVRLQKLSKAKSEFVSIASHQLRTPLSVIKGFLSMISEGFYGPVPDKIKLNLKKTLESNERLIKLVDDLLDLSHMEEGRMKFNFEIISLRDLVESVGESLETKAKNKGLKFIYHCDKQDKFLIKADARKIRQVIYNLIDNAIKYTEKGRVQAKLERIKSQIMFKVKDTGFGVGKEEQKHLFKRFSRGKKVSQLWKRGSGLGLYVARLIVEAHEGKIGVNSEGEGKGSEFWVKLPKAKIKH